MENRTWNPGSAMVSGCGPRSGGPFGICPDPGHPTQNVTFRKNNVTCRNCTRTSTCPGPAGPSRRLGQLHQPNAPSRSPTAVSHLTPRLAVCPPTSRPLYRSVFFSVPCLSFSRSLYLPACLMYVWCLPACLPAAYLSVCLSFCCLPACLSL